MNRKSPISRKGVEPQVLTNPVGIDILVKALQEDFASNIPWLEKSFNRADISTRVNIDAEGGEEVFNFPKCWVDDGSDELEMIGLDNWNSYSFFSAIGNETPLDYDDADSNIYTRDLNLYVWMNLDAINPTRSGGYLETLKQDVLARIREYSPNGAIGVEVNLIVDNSLDVFTDFTTELPFTQFISDPYRALRFDLTAFYPDANQC